MSFFCINCKSQTSPEYKACPFCGEPITDFLRRYLEAPLDGKYKIVSRLGVGGMGEVYKVLHLHLNALRVVKLMRASVSRDPSAHERFVREARLATRIHHPNVATLFDFSTLDDGTHYMVWEYIEGMTLGELLRVRGALSPRYAARISIQVLAGLEAIHRSGVVHRDVSPENIMITSDDEGGETVKIIDLGIAKQSTETSDSSTKTGMFVGKWKYCSPEQLGMLKDDEAIDRRADLYSYGVVLYEMLAGEPPFTADSPHRYLLMHATEAPRPLADLRPDMGKASELEALIFRALEKERDRRFASARQFAAALEAILPQLSDVSPSGISSRRQEDEETAEHLLVATTESTSSGTASKEGPATVVSPAIRRDIHAEETVVSPGDKTLIGGPVSVEQQLQPRRAKWPIAAVIALLLIGGGVTAFYIHNGKVTTRTPEIPRSETNVSAQQLVTPTQPETALTSATTNTALSTATQGTAQGSAASAIVAVDSVPWSEVITIRNVESGATVPLSATVTPARVPVPAGTYDVTLRTPSGVTATKRVTATAASVGLLHVELSPLPDLPSFGGEE